MTLAKEIVDIAHEIRRLSTHLSGDHATARTRRQNYSSAHVAEQPPGGNWGCCLILGRGSAQVFVFPAPNLERLLCLPTESAVRWNAVHHHRRRP